MINPTEPLEITAMYYVPQFNCKVSKYYDADFFVTPARLETMYLNKYDTKGYYINQHPFKAVSC